MARPREFDREEALGRAMEVFWSKGYDATSVQDLVDATGVSRQSLYDTFGDKDGLYLAALDHYTAGGEPFARSLEEPVGGPLAVLRRTFFQIARDAAGEQRGCLIINAAIERAGCSPEVERCVKANIHRLETAFTTLVQRAQALGEIPASVDARGAARTLVTMLWGFRAMTRGHGSEAWLRSVADHVLGLMSAGSAHD